MDTKIKYFPEVTIAPEEASVTQCQELVCQIRPDWEGKHIKGQVLTGGHVNTLLLLHLSEDFDQKDAVVFRIFCDLGVLKPDENGDIPGILSRDMEFISMQIAWAAGCAARVFAVFANGFVYQYIRGRILREDDLKNPKIVRSVARSMASLHHMNVQSQSLLDRKGRKATVAEEPSIRYFRHLRKYFQSAPTKIRNAERNARYQASYGDMALYEKELQFIQEFIEEMEPPFAHCHNDPHFKNIIYNEDEDRATFVDFELSEVNYCTYDVSLFFNLLHYIPTLGGCSLSPEHDRIPATLGTWVDAYLERKYELQDCRDTKATSAQRRMLEIEVEIFLIVHHFYWLGICFFMCLLDLASDFTASMKPAWETYCKLKPKLQPLKEEYMAMKKKKTLR